MLFVRYLIESLYDVFKLVKDEINVFEIDKIPLKSKSSNHLQSLINFEALFGSIQKMASEIQPSHLLGPINP